MKKCGLSSFLLCILSLGNALEFVPVWQDASFPVNSSDVCSGKSMGECPKAGALALNSTCQSFALSYDSRSHQCIAPVDAQCIYSSTHQQHECRYPYTRVVGDKHQFKALFPQTNSSCGITDTTMGDCPQAEAIAVENCDPADAMYNHFMGQCVAIRNSKCMLINDIYQCSSQLQYIQHSSCKYSYYASSDQECPREDQKLYVERSSPLTRFYSFETHSYYAPEDAEYHPRTQQCRFPSYEFPCQSTKLIYTGQAPRFSYLEAMVGALLGLALGGIGYFFIRSRPQHPQMELPLMNLPSECIVEPVHPIARRVGDPHPVRPSTPVVLAPAPN